MNRFRTTRWSLVLDAGGEAGHAHRALDELCRIYRPPVFAFVRRRGWAHAEAEDITQAFFEQLLRLRSYATADPARGRFRTFLQVALVRFLGHHAEATRAAKRGGGLAALSLEQDALAAQVASGDDTPDAAFERDWANAVLQEALAALAAESAAAGKGELFVALKPFLFEPPAPAEYARVAAQLGIRRNTLAVAIHRLRQRLHERVRSELAETVSGAEELEGEMGLLQAALGAKFAADPTPG